MTTFMAASYVSLITAPGWFLLGYFWGRYEAARRHQFTRVANYRRREK